MASELNSKLIMQNNVGMRAYSARQPKMDLGDIVLMSNNYGQQYP